jgi:undecaprenyl-diphosphatase
VVEQAVATLPPAMQPAATTVAQTTQTAAQTVTDATKQAQAAVQQAAQQATVSPRKALYRGRRFIVIYALLVAALAFLGALARRYKVLPGDVGITRLIQEPDSHSYGLLMGLVSEMGWQWPSVITRLTTTGLMWSAGFRMEGAFTAATWSADMVTVLIKETIGRPRPTRDLVRVTHTLGEHSFPSGHVVHYVTFYGFVFYILWSHLKEGKGRNGVLTLLALVVLLIGPSRVYQGAHWPSDVAAAYLVGSLWLAVLIVSYIETKARFQLNTRWPFLARRSREL